MSHGREPIKHTCPDIDKIVKSIKEIEKSCNLRGREDESDLKEIISDVSNEVYGLDREMEKLRKSNDELRCWGIDEANEVDHLEAQYIRMKEIIKGRISTIQSEPDEIVRETMIENILVDL
jgi:hypothetical protein